MEAVTGGVSIWTSRRGTLLLGVAAGVLIGLAAGLLIGRDSAPVETSPRVPAQPAAGPTRTINGVPVGYARTEEGAVLAATNFGLVTTSELIGDRAAYTEAIETFAAPTWLEQASREARNGHEFAVNHYGSDVQMVSAVLRYEVLSYSDRRASVRLWTVTVASGSERPTAEAIWGTSTLELAWTDDDWRVVDTDNSPGPAPVVLQSPAEEEAIRSLMEESNAFTKGPRP